MPLKPDQLKRQRQIANRDLVERCSIERASSVQDDFGETNQSFAVLSADVPCRVVETASVTGRERVRLEGLAQVTDWMVIVPVGQDVTSQDRLRITKGTSAGRIFEATQVLGPHTEEVRRRVMVEVTT
jgi:hypothetical protein